jgi:periplasmic copper chaperone A
LLPHMRRSSIIAAVTAALFVLLPATPAAAHATFVGAPSGFPINSDQALTMNVPDERDDTTYNVEVVVDVPDGWTALSCQGKPTWTCSLTTLSGRPVVRFTKAAGAAVAEDQAFQFAVRTAATVGLFPFRTLQTYNTGEIVRWIGAAGSANPAPMLTTLPGGTAAQTTAPPPPNPDAPPTSVGATSSTTSSATSSSSSTSTDAPAPTTRPSSGRDDGGGNGGAVAAIAIGAIALAGGGAWAWRRHSQSRLRNRP